MYYFNGIFKKCLVLMNTVTNCALVYVEAWHLSLRPFPISTGIHLNIGFN
jgi:hypothetical protein